MCGGGEILVANLAADEALFKALTNAGPRQMVVVDKAADVRWLPRTPVHGNCRNCGAPPEPVCSYCTTVAE